MIQITQVGFVFFPFLFGVSPPTRGSASAWPSRLTCSNSFVLLSNVSPQTLHCVSRMTISLTAKLNEEMTKRGRNYPWIRVRCGKPKKRKKEGDARGIESPKLTAQPLFASLSCAFFATSRALRFSRFDNGSPFVEFAAAAAVPAPSSSRTVVSLPPFLAWWDSVGVSVSVVSRSSSEDTRSPPVC